MLPLNSPIIINIDNDMIWKATEYVHKMHLLAKLNGCRSIMKYNFENDVQGKLAELCFEKILKQWNINYKTEVTMGGSDRFDFLINDKIIIDVKSSVKPKLNIAWQHLLKDTKYFIFIRMDLPNNRALFCGWIENSRAKNRKVHKAVNPYISIHWRKLNNPNDLQEKLK